MAWFLDQPNSKGTKHSYVNYSSSHSSESYEAKTAQVIQFRGVPATDYEHSSPRKVDHSLMPWGFVRDRPEKPDGLSPRFRDAVHIQEKGSPTKDFHRGNNPPMRDRDFGKYNHFESSDDDDDDDDYECDDGVCRVKNTKLGTRPNSFKEAGEGYDRNFEKYNQNGYDHSEPRKHTYYDKSYDDLDLEKDKRKSYLTRNEPFYEDHSNEKEKGKFNGAYKVPTYSYIVPSSNQPKKDTYYDQAPPAYYNDKRKGGDYTPPYTVPATIIPKNDNRPIMMNPPPIKTRPDSWGKDTDYYNENGKNSPKYNSPRKDQGYDPSNNRPMMINPPPAIKTRNNMSRDEEYYTENGKNSPKYNSPLGKDHQGYGGTIDSAEARRRYGKVGQPRGAVYVAEDYTSGVIDSREAARRYKGVLLTN